MTIVLGAGKGEVQHWQELLGDPPHLRNPPGLDELRYRIGTYDSWVELMIHALMEWEYFPLATGATEVSSETTFMSRRLLPTSSKRRIRLNLSEEDNWILGLLSSWATVADVLTFYQERLLNEGYLRTARQSLSVHELARLLDQRPDPAVGGEVKLALSASEVEGLPPRVTLAPGTPVTSVPPPGADPQHFETGPATEARAEWNLLRPMQVDETAPPVLCGASTSLRLKGTASGLSPGAGLLIRGTRASQPVAWFRPVNDVASQQSDPPDQVVSWRAPLDPARPEDSVEELEAYALRQSAQLFGCHAPRWDAEPIDVRRRYRPIAGGVQVFTAAEGWRSLNEGLPELAIQCLIADAHGNLFAGTAGRGVFSRLAGSPSWRHGQGGLAQLDVRSLAVEAGGGMIAGTATGGIYRSTDRGAIWTELTGRTLGRARWTMVRRSKQLDRLPETPVRALLSSGDSASWSLLTGTDSGIYLSTDLANSWQPRNSGLPGVDAKTGETSLVISVLVAGASRSEIYAGTASGVFKSGNLGRPWRAINRGLPGTDLATGLTSEAVGGLAFHHDRRRRAEHLFAGTSQGVFRSNDGGATWKAARDGMLPDGGQGFAQITSLMVVEDPITVTTQVFASGPDGLWRSRDLGDSWTGVELGAPAVTAMALGPRSELAVAGPLGGFDEDQWPGFHLSGGHIDLEREVPGVPADSWVALVPDPDDDDPPPVGIYRVLDVTAVHRRDFSLEAQVTRIEVTPDPALHRFDLRTARAYFASDALALKPRSRPADPATALAKLRQMLQQMDAARSLIVDAEKSRRQAESEDPYAGYATAGQLEAALAAAASGSAVGAEALELRAEDPEAGSDPFATPRMERLDPLSVAVHGNLVEATEGRTIREEILGNGDASQILQRFELSEPPAYLRGAPAPRSTIEIRVQGQVWREVPRLYGEGPTSRVFEVQRDHAGRATIIFGDGVNGARLPSGRANVVANYRTGTSDRDILPGSVRLMASRPLGLAAIGNPIAGTPGAPAEDPDSVRERAPRSVLTLGRIVSLRDYEDFAWSFPGIVRATAKTLALAGRQIIHITVAIRGGDHRPAPGSSLLRQLLAAIEEIRCDPEPVHIVPFRRVGLEIDASVRIAPGFLWEEVEPGLRAALSDRFSFARSRFGDSPSASEAVRVLQSMPGVVAVDLDLFRRSGDSEPLARRVEARSTFWDGRSESPEPAELVWLDSLRLHEPARPEPAAEPMEDS